MSDFEFISFVQRNPILVDVLYRSMRENPSRLSPYHNSQHMYETAVIADQLFLAEGGRANSIQRQSLAHAALMHDFAHSGGAENDAVNIAIAISNLKQEGKFEYDVVKIIMCTEFPFTRLPETLAEMCMRDADILYATLNGDPRIIMEGLRSEIAFAKGHEITYDDMYQGQVEFLSEVRMFTEEGKRLFALHSENYIESMKEYMDAKHAAYVYK